MIDADSGQYGTVVQYGSKRMAKRLEKSERAIHGSTAGREPDVDNLIAGNDLYETDFYAWTQQQATLIKQGRLEAVDLTNILEEIETLGRKEVSELRSRYKTLALHLLKALYQPEKLSRSWRTTILNQRIEIGRHIDDNPSLKSKAEAIFATAYADARQLAASETGLTLETFPLEPPFDKEKAISKTFQPWPGA